MKIFSTFTGIGGFEIGIEKAYEHALALHGESMGNLGPSARRQVFEQTKEEEVSHE